MSLGLKGVNLGFLGDDSCSGLDGPAVITCGGDGGLITVGAVNSPHP